MPSAITARLRPDVGAQDAREWRSQVILHPIYDAPPIAPLEISIAGKWCRRDLVDAVGEIAELLVQRGLISDATPTSSSRRFAA